VVGHRWGLVAGGIAAVIAITAGILIMGGLGSRGSALLHEGARVVLADLGTQTGEDEVALAATEWFRTDLARSEHLVLVTPLDVAEAIERMRADDRILTPEIAREIAIRDGHAATLEGNVDGVGSGFLLTVQLVDPATGQIIHSDNEAASIADDLIDAIERLSARLRERAGEALPAIRSNPPLPQVTTTSLEALTEFAKGRDAAFTGDWDRAELHYQEAIARDSAFAMAHMLLGLAYRDRGYRGGALRELQAAYDLREGLPHRQRAYVTGAYHEYVSLDLDRARAAWRDVVENDPAQRVHALNFLGLLEMAEARYAEAEAAFARATELEPDLTGAPWWNLVAVQTQLGKTDEAFASLEAFEGHFGPAQSLRTRVQFALGEFDDAEAQLLQRLEGEGDPASRSELGQLALIHLIRGKFEEFERLWADRVAFVESTGNLAYTLRLQVWERARAHLLVRNDTAAAIAVALEASSGPTLARDQTTPVLELMLAQFWAQAGDLDLARAQTERYESVVPEGEQHRHLKRLLEVEGRIQLGEGDREEAIRTLRRAVDHPDPPFYCTQCPVVALGEVYDALGQTAAAIEQYERFGKSRWIFGQEGTLDPLYLPRTHERLAQLYEELDDTTRAVEHHQAFVDLWRDADPELQARVEAAREAIQRLSR
jgi:tetratricopeptide (TPR) repeat protein